MNQENCFSVSKAKFELVFLGSLHPPSWVGGWAAGVPLSISCGAVS